MAAQYLINYQELQKLLNETFGETDLSNSFQNIKKIKKQIDDYLIRYEDYSSKIYAKYQSLAREDKIESNTARRYQAVKSFNEQTDDIKNLLKEGYLYVDAIRESLTGEKIKYQIGLIDKNTKTLYEGTIDITDLIEYSTLDVDSKVSIRNAAKLRLTKIPVNKLSNLDQQKIQTDTENASSVFSAVYNYLTVTLHQVPKVNEGNAYEVYRRVLYERQGKNKIPPPVTFEEIDKTYEEVKRNNAAYYKGGDIADIQVKFLGGSPPSLTTLSSIKRVLTKVSKALDVVNQETKSNQKMAKSLANLLTQKTTSLPSEAEKITNAIIQREVEEKIKKLSNLK